MSRRARPRLPKEVTALRFRVTRWRQRRPKRSPMPEDLWQAAAALARTHGIHPIAKALGLNYENLKKRTTHGGRGRRKREQGPSEFVELSAAQLLGQPSPTRKVELSAGDGTGMTIHLAASDALDVVALAQAFWNRPR